MRALVAVDRGDLQFAVLIAIGFNCLLRTGEFLSLQYKDLEFTPACGVVSLRSSKSGLRAGSEEAIAIRDLLVLELLHTLFVVHSHHPGNKLWPSSAQAFRTKFAQYMQFFRISHVKMKPYSLRRGGATYMLQEGIPLDVILLRGRWRSLNVAYLEDGVSQIPQLRIDDSDKARISVFADKCPTTAFRP